MIQTTKDKSIEHNLSWMLFCHLHVFIYLITLIILTPIDLENITIEVRRTRKTHYFRDIQIFLILLSYQIKSKHIILIIVYSLSSAFPYAQVMA